MSEPIRTLFLNAIQGLLQAPEGAHLTPEEIQALPRRQVQDDRTSVCSICIEQIVTGQTAIDLQCNHSFHEECLITWFNTHNTCPMCRRIYGATPDTSSTAVQPSIQFSIVPVDINLNFIVNGNVVRTTWNPRTRTLIDMFTFLHTLTALYNSQEVIVSNLRNVRQSFRTSQSYQSLYSTLADNGVLHDTTFHVYSS